MKQVPDVLEFLFEQLFNPQHQRWFRYASPKYKGFVTALSENHGIFETGRKNMSNRILSNIKCV